MPGHNNRVIRKPYNHKKMINSPLCIVDPSGGRHDTVVMVDNNHSDLSNFNSRAVSTTTNRHHLYYHSIVPSLLQYQFEWIISNKIGMLNNGKEKLSFSNQIK